MTVRMGTKADKAEIIGKRPQAEGYFSDGGYFVVAEENGAVAGFAAVFSRDIPAPVSGREAFINLIEVFEEYQRKGAATLLVQEILKIERNNGTYQVRAYCDINNSASHALWRKNKFGIAPVKMQDGSILGSFVTYVL
ncbi:MAG: GNAT family N-acetyltransferase [Oscillospiraceae bacterium]|nr:GNAT family N-acetyltransferase [Oscillospiraceae bacterium]